MLTILPKDFPKPEYIIEVKPEEQDSVILELESELNRLKGISETNLQDILGDSEIK